MLTLDIWGSAIAILVGLALGLYVHFGKDDIQIPPWEYAACGLVLLLMLVPLTSYIGYELSISSNTTFYEFWNGYEVRTYPVTYSCYESDSEGGSTGGCTHYYDCDSYTVTVDDPDTEDDDGHTVHHSHEETRYRQCPYTTTEITWMVGTTLGDFNVGNHWLPANPQDHRLRPESDWTHSLPDLDSGTPEPWTEASDRLARAQPAAVTAEKSYTNYVLASDSALLVAHSQDIDSYLKQGLLPELNHDIYNYYFADRVYFVGVQVPDPRAWQLQLAKLNAALGVTEQGNLYVVIVDASKVPSSSSESYTTALTAYWESAPFGRYAVSMNALIVVVATKDGKTIDWAKASTGMPKGNEFMLGDIRSQLAGVKLDPRALLGEPTMQFPPKQDGDQLIVSINHNEPQGALEKILWGPNHFERVPMDFYAYLRGELTLTTGQKIGTLTTIFLISLLAWGFICYHAVPAYHRYRGTRFDR